MPPLRELAPQPTVSASSTAVFTPFFASVRAAESPVKPAPTMATSTLAGSASGRGFGISTVSTQKVLCLICGPGLIRINCRDPQSSGQQYARHQGEGNAQTLPRAELFMQKQNAQHNRHQWIQRRKRDHGRGLALFECRKEGEESNKCAEAAGRGPAESRRGPLNVEALHGEDRSEERR